MKKQIVAILLVVVLMLNLLPNVLAFATSETATTTSTTTTTTGESTSTTLTIPSNTTTTARAIVKKDYVARKTSDLGVGFIEAFEGYYQFQYWDYQHYTIGYGTTCEKDEYPGGISEAFAHQLLKKNLPSYEAGLNSFLKTNNIYVTQNQYDALISFTYNFGAYIWQREPTIAKYLKDGIENYTDQQIADAFGLWVNAGGVTVQGLVDRRAAEAKYFCTDDFGFNQEVYVVTDSVSIRSGAGTSYSKIGSLKRGDLVVVSEKKYVADVVWGKIANDNLECWFSLNYAKFGLDETDKDKLIATCLYKVENVENGIALYWKKVKGATGYKIYKKQGSKDFELLKTIETNATTTFVDTDVAEQSYSYYVVSYKNSKDAKSSGICQITFTKSVELKSLNVLANGFKLSWKKLNGAESYKVMRANESDSTFVTIASVTNTSYTDTTAVGGVVYYYTVKVVKNGGLSGAAQAKSGVYLSAPAISSASNTKADITINWSVCAKATGYYVYRKAATETKFKLVSTINNPNTVSYKDTNVTTGVNYVYYLKAFSTELESVKSAEFTAALYAAPKIKKAKAVATGIKLTWAKVSGVASYNVYRRAKNEKNFTKIANVTTNSYVDTTVAGNMKYYYRLTSVGASGCESYRSGAKSCKSISSTKIIAATRVKKGIELKWEKVSGAVSYSVYRFVSNEYKLVKTVTTDKLVVKFGKSVERIYAVKVNYADVSSDYSPQFKAYKLETPVLKISKTKNGLLLSWDKVKNATGMIIYRKEAGGKFKLYTELPVYEKNTFENTTTTKGKKYYYKIKVVGSGSVSLVSNVVSKKF